MFVAVGLSPLISDPVLAIEASQLALIINTSDPLSVQIGEYYAEQRRLSFQNIIRVAFPPNRASLDRDEFETLKAAIDKRMMPKVQAIALTWAQPYRVQCMSITSAFAFGYAPEFCEPGCKPTRPSRYFNSRAQHPYSQLGIRPTMAIAAKSFEQAKVLIDRGIKSDGTFPQGTAYLLTSSDKLRSVRDATYASAQRIFNDGHVRTRRLRQDELKEVRDVLFYFIGLANVSSLETLQFVPGAIADHLTSSGGVLSGQSGQMSALRWLEAGATASYGTVVEPCNLAQKFPNPALLATHYLDGDTAIEAYWKSVAMPGQGVFVGEPLAAPFRKSAR